MCDVEPCALADVGYMRALSRSITKGGKAWRRCWPPPPGGEASASLLDKLLVKLRELGNDQPRGNYEAEIAEVHRQWCAAERSERIKAARAEAEAAGNEPQTVKLKEVTEISYRYFGAACASTLGDEFVASFRGEPFDRSSNVFRRLDVDGNGTISVKDLKAAVIDDVMSKWFEHLPSNVKRRGLGGLTKSASASGKIRAGIKSVVHVRRVSSSMAIHPMQ